MFGNRRNLVFRVSIVINIAVLLYAAMQLSNTNQPMVEWVPLSSAGGAGVATDRLSDTRFIIDNEMRNFSLESSVRNFEESTPEKLAATMSTTNKTSSSTPSLTEMDRKLPREVPSEVYPTNETGLQLNEDILSTATLTKLRTLLRCSDREFVPQTKQRGEFLVMFNYVRADHGLVPCHGTVTYTTHAGFEFLDNVPPLIERWVAPISLTIHAPGSDIMPAINSIRYLRDCYGLIRKFVTFHVFFSNKHIPSKIPNPDVFLKHPYNCSVPPPYTWMNLSNTYMKKNSLLYPVNMARNIARDAALTHFILPSDIELYPSPNLVPKFLNMIARNKPPLNTSKKPRVFPISIFEVDAKVRVPSSKTELKTMLAKKTAIPFHKYVCPNCHNIPQGQQWMNAAETDHMDVFHVGKRHGSYVHWEPIFIGTHQDPYYDERLSWEGKQDKMTQGYVLCVKDYDFMILNNAFLIHKPGIKRYKKDRKRDFIASRQSKLIRTVIKPELMKLYGELKGCSL